MSKLEYMQDIERQLSEAQQCSAELEVENAECEEWGKSEARMKEKAEAERDLAQKTRDQAQQDVIEAAAERDALREAARAVCWFDFCDDDDDVVVAVAQLRSVLDGQPHEAGGG